MSDDQGKKDSQEVINIALLPLRELIVFPTTVVPLFVGREKSIQALEYAMSTNKEIFMSAQKEAKIENPSEDEIFEVGTICTILQFLRLPDGAVKVLVEGKRRARIVEYQQSDSYYSVTAEVMDDLVSEDLENEALLRTVKMSFDNYVRLNKRIPPELLLTISQIDNEAKLADTLVLHIPSLKLKDKQDLLEETNAKIRLEKIYGFLQSEIEIMRVEKKIRARVKKQMERTQKEYYLNEQMAAIQKELGDRDDYRNEFSEMEKQIKTRKISEEAREKLSKEVRKLKSMSPMSAEATVVRNYIETVLGLPWYDNLSEEINDIVHAENILNKDHFGLDKVKERVLEYLSIRSLAGNLKGPILCLVGPPGVGKTSLAKSIAESTGREFVRIALGGVRDEAEVRGHRRTYIGSMPGKIIMGLKKAGSSNPVMLLDEIDKMAHDHRGDPSSALLEVLDPAQNHSFNDHYLDLDYDLSRVLFLATANTYAGIPRPLLDRMEIINLSGYTEEEKLQIAKNFLLPKQLKENGLGNQDIKFNSKAIREVINYYTREAGVRSLERQVAAVLRKVAMKHLKKFNQQDGPEGADIKTEAPPKAEMAIKKDSQQVNLSNATQEIVPGAKEAGAKISGSKSKEGKIEINISETVNEKSVNKYLGPRKYRVGMQNDQNEIGLATGMAYTEVGGDLLVVEISVVDGGGKIKLTGKLGEVMQESAQAAISYVRTRSEFLGVDSDFYKNKDIHIHVPEGATPKDGPSAGICIATAITSALTLRPVNRFVAMTGEITLRGRVLPIGGLKEKVMAAHRGGIKKIILPIDNEKDIADIPKTIAKDLKFICVSHMDEVLIHALAWEPVDENSGIEDDLFNKLKNVIDTEFTDSDLRMAAH